MIGPLLVDYDGCATILGLDSANWLEENIRVLPHTRLGRYVRFSEDNMREIVTLHLVRPAQSAPTTQQVPAALLDLTPGRAPRPRRKAG